METPHGGWAAGRPPERERPADSRRWKGYDKNAFREWLRDHDVRPLIRHCIYTTYDHAYNARMNDELYNRRWLGETRFSMVKRLHGATVRVQTRYREFRECVLMFVIYNVKRASSAL
jgi:IS5 family transposase